MKIGVVRFPGSNCDFDVFQFCGELGHRAQWLWHRDRFEIKDVDAVIIPGGFSYGDYLRCGAMAAKAPVMDAVADFAGAGKPVLGICNGFQILCERGLLPGVLLKNSHGKFNDGWVEIECMQPSAVFGSGVSPREILRLPVAHGDGRYFLPEEQLNSLEDRGQVWFRYKNNPNGSCHDIAGVLNSQKNVGGLMPHPERALWAWAGSEDGRRFL